MVLEPVVLGCGSRACGIRACGIRTCGSCGIRACCGAPLQVLLLLLLCCLVGRHSPLLSLFCMPTLMTHFSKFS